MLGCINDSLRFGWVPGISGVVPAKAGTHNHRIWLSKEGL